MFYFGKGINLSCKLISRKSVPFILPQSTPLSPYTTHITISPHHLSISHSHSSASGWPRRHRHRYLSPKAHGEARIHFFPALRALGSPPVAFAFTAAAAFVRCCKPPHVVVTWSPPKAWALSPGSLAPSPLFWFGGPATSYLPDSVAAIVATSGRHIQLQFLLNLLLIDCLFYWLSCSLLGLWR